MPEENPQRNQRTKNFSELFRRKRKPKKTGNFTPPFSIQIFAADYSSPRADLFGGRVILTNGFEFVFLHGHIEMFRTPQSYYELQDPALMPKLYGKVVLKEKDAISIARNAVIKMGYTNDSLSTSRPPQVTKPVKIGTNYVPRYRIRWNDPTHGSPESPAPSVEFEINATTGQIQLMYLLNMNAWRDSPKIDVHPPVIGKAAETKHEGGRKIVPVSQAYSNAFLKAILPQCDSYVARAGFKLKTPVSTNDLVMSRYVCGMVDNDPIAFIDLKSGARFVYGHGQVIALYSPNIMHLPGEEDKPIQQFFGPVNMTTKQAVSLVRQTVARLGYSEKVLHMDQPPQVTGPQRYGTNTIARYNLDWKESWAGAFWVVAEIDARTKTLESLYINDHAITNIWREPPEIGVSTEAIPLR